VRILETLAKLCAVLAGLLLISITLMTCYSVIGRDFFQSALVGDIELVGVVTGAAIALFMPWCQLQRGNIIVDFFTNRASARAQAGLDRVGALLIGVFMAVLAWRGTLGGLNAYQNQSGTMMLNFPEWITYACMVPPLALAALIALLQAAFGFTGKAHA
jgi:TRAP-type C4-dicarboxylate transport system permease small subunit